MFLAILIEQPPHQHLLFDPADSFAAGLILLAVGLVFGFVERQRKRKKQTQGYSRSLWLLLGSGAGLIVLSLLTDYFYPGPPFQCILSG
jgi:vacuolar-type H+-ATPase subunit I/STV1